MKTYKNDNKKLIYYDEGNTTEFNRSSKIKKKLQNIKQSFDISKNKEKLTGAKLIKKLATESSNLPPEMRQIDVRKLERVNREVTNMNDDMISKEKAIPEHYDNSTIVVDQNADRKIIETDVQITPKTLTLPKPSEKKLKKVAVVNIERKTRTNMKINDKPSSDNKSTETEVENNETLDDETNLSEELKSFDIFLENLNNNNKEQLIINEKYDMDILDYSDMTESLIDSTSEKSNHNRQINVDHENICSESTENTSRSSRKKVTSTSNDNDNTFPDNDSSSPNHDNSTPNNDNSCPDNDNPPPNNQDIPPRNVESSPNNGNIAVDSTQSNDKPLDSANFQSFVLAIKMFLCQLSISFKNIYDFM